MLVAERNGPDGSFLETIIVDSKLSKATDWTDNQRDARKLGEWSVKAISPSNLIQGEQILGFVKDKTVSKTGDFIKLFQENGVLKAQ